MQAMVEGVAPDRLRDPTTAITATIATSTDTPTRATCRRSGIGYVPTCAVSIFALTVPPLHKAARAARRT